MFTCVTALAEVDVIVDGIHELLKDIRVIGWINPGFSLLQEGSAARSGMR